MSLIEKISYKIALKLGKETNKSDEEISIINYGLFTIIHTLIGIILTIIAGFIIKKTIEIIIISIVAASLKRYSGGVHATSANRCLIIGLVTSIINTYISEILFKFGNSKTIGIFSLSTVIISFIIFYKKHL